MSSLCATYDEPLQLQLWHCQELTGLEQKQIGYHKYIYGGCVLAC